MVWQEEEKVGRIFSFGFPWEVAGEMRLRFTAVFTEHHAGRKERKAADGRRGQMLESVDDRWNGPKV